MMIKKSVLVLLSFLAFANTSPSYAIDELVIAQLTNPSAATDDNKSANNADDTPIASQATPIDDAQIYDRIYGIFSEVDGLSSVKVTVNQGVVKLSGETANEKKATQAVKLANRISGVVTVEDDISRTLDIQDNVTPVVNDLVNQSKAGLKALPLLLVHYWHLPWWHGLAAGCLAVKNFGNALRQILLLQNFWPKQLKSFLLC